MAALVVRCPWCRVATAAPYRFRHGTDAVLAERVAGRFEPVGTRPAARGEGLTRELIREGFRRLAEHGMATAHTETPGFNAPAQALYESSGFTPTGRRRTYIKRLDVPALTPATAGAPAGSMF